MTGDATSADGGDEEEARSPGALAAALTADGALRSPRWIRAFKRVPRHVFVSRIYADPRHTGDYVPVTGEEPEQRGSWLNLVYSDEPLVTELEDGGTWRSSSSQPSLMARMLEALDVHGDERVLEIGTGTGYNAALLCEGLGSTQVVSIDIEPALVEAARRRLRQLGYSPVLTAADGVGAYPAAAPYDRIIATCSLPRLPAAWISQTADDGLILLNLYRELGGGALAVLRVADGQASGHFAPFFGGFMPTRTITSVSGIALISAHSGKRGDSRETGLPADVLDDDAFGMLAALALSGVQKIGLLPDGKPEQTWLIGQDGSWAYQEDGGTAVVQGGPERLWDRLEALHSDWVQAGRPMRQDFRLTVTSAGQHRLWTAEPHDPEWLI